jgi:hypothetical protein
MPTIDTNCIGMDAVNKYQKRASFFASALQTVP